MTSLDTTVAVIDAAARSQVPVLLWSDPGMGKSSVVRALAAADGVPVETVIGSQREPVDIAGWPVVADGAVQTLALPDWAKTLIDAGGGYLLLDEISTCSASVQAAMLTVALERVVGRTKLPDEVRIVAAANPPDHSAGGVDLTPPMANRFLHINFEPSPQEWLTGMRSSFAALPASRAVSADDVRAAEEVGAVCAFIEARPELLHQYPDTDEAAGRAWPSRRSWEATARVLSHLRRDDTAAIAAVVVGLVGDGAGSEYMQFRASIDLPSVIDVLADPSIVDWANARPDQVWAVLSGVVAWASSKGTKDAWTTAWGPLVAAATHGAPDVAGAAARALGVAMPPGAKPPAAARQFKDVMIAARSARGERSVSEIRALSPDEWRRLRLARMAAVEAMPYYAHALFALSPVAAPGLGTFAVDRHWRLYLDPAMLGTGEGWSIPQAGAVLLHEVGHVLRDHGARADSVDSPVDRMMWNVAADAEINDDLIAAGLGLPDGVVTPTGIGCEDGHAAEVYYRLLVPPGAPRSNPHDPGAGDEGCGCGSGAGDAPAPGELPAAADVGGGTGLSDAAADLVKVAVARAVQHELQSPGAGRGTMPAGIARWAARQLAPAVVSWPKVLRAAVRRAIEDQAGQVHHSWRRPNRRAPAGLLLPTLRAPKIAVDLIIDTSASMGDDDLAAALSETRAVLRRTGASARVLCCDAAATTPRAVRSISDVTLTGGGGTDLRAGIDAALAARPAANVIVAFTVGGTPWPERRLPVPLIVALIGQHASDSAPAWAKTVRVTPAQTAAA